MVIVVMGPAGAGKTTVGHALAARLGWVFVDADDHHAPASLAKMAAGTPLTDADRAGWLETLHALVLRAIDRREPLVLACSALTAQHRAHLTGDLRTIRFVYLRVAPALLRERLRTRRNHVAGEGLLESQLATLEEPGPEALTLDGEADLDTLIGHVRLEFGL
ncbi:MAG TPA: gluconokinase, GntK/IdnK-type [Vicinamibacterales bacterium]|nr:gluconokinase, GntK/IdnK-type [Vicinamibacterales bacterium]